MSKDTHVWHPCQQMKDFEKYPPLRVKSGKGIYLYDFEGNSYIDAVSSWWVNLFGHCNPRIIEAVNRQHRLLEHVIFAGVSHEPGEKLAEKLVEIMPEGLNRVFFADNGSAAVEAAMKMSFGCWKHSGVAGKTKFIYLTSGYHGETLGALSVCGEDFFSEFFREIMPHNLRVQGPDCYRCPYGLTRETCAAECFEHMQRALDEHGRETCAVMLEPLVQCAGGFRMHPPVYLEKLRKATREAGVHLILDEIAVGFGRTGTMFAAEQANITADLVCVSKGITSGNLPLSAVLTTDEIYDAYYCDWQDLKAFWHSHSYTGNPLACAAALETLQIFEDDNVIKTNRPKWQHLAATARDRFEGHPHVGEIRATGFICAIELTEDPATKKPFDWKSRTGFRIYREALKRGALLRNMGDVVYFMPPYVITEEEITRLVDIARESVREVLGC